MISWFIWNDLQKVTINKSYPNYTCYTKATTIVMHLVAPYTLSNVPFSQLIWKGNLYVNYMHFGDLVAWITLQWRHNEKWPVDSPPPHTHTIHIVKCAVYWRTSLDMLSINGEITRDICHKNLYIQFIENSSKIWIFPTKQNQYSRTWRLPCAQMRGHFGLNMLTNKTTKCNAFTWLFNFHFNGICHLVIFCTAPYHRKQTPSSNSYSSRLIH